MRLFFLQVVSFGYYKDLAENQHQLEQQLIPERGEIFIRDRYSKNLYPAVTNINRPLVYAVPQQIKDTPKTAQIIAATLGLDRKEVLERISDQSRQYIVLKKQVAEETAGELANFRLPGIFFESENHLFYPEKQLLAQVLGFVAFEEDRREGRYGLEKYFEKELAGIPGSLRGTRDTKGNWITGGERKVVPAQDGMDLILTIDRAIQFKVEEVLTRAVQAHGAKKGVAVVLNPKTGAVLAMASVPGFDPNHFNEVEDPGIYNNLVIQLAYEPGSVMKPVTFAGALNEGAVTPDMTFEDPGAITLEKFTIRNADNKTYGQVSMTQVLEQSINTGAIFAEQKLGHKKFLEYLEAFGFGQSAKITLPFEDKGSIDNLYRGGDLYPATASFGQGITVTPLQLASAFGAIANGGKMYQPYVVQEKIFFDGRREVTQPTARGEIISHQTASTLSAMLASVVEKGHGKRAAVPGYFIAGKTGTAQVAYTDRAGYDPNRTIGTFAGFGPVEDPAFVIAVKIEEPQYVRFAESTAAPVFGEIAQFILNYYQIPKSR